VPVKPALARGGRDDQQVETARTTLALEHLRQPGQHRRAAPSRCHRQQPHFADAGAGRQIVIEVRQLRVEREWSLRAQRGHAGERRAQPAGQADQVGVLRVKAIDQASCFVRRVLRNLLDERGVVQAVDRLELGVVIGNLEVQ